MSEWQERMAPRVREFYLAPNGARMLPTPRIAFLLITDGRAEYLERSLASALAYLPRFRHYIVIDDSDHRLGFGGAIQEGWRRVLETDAEWVFHLEADFEFLRAVNIEGMLNALEMNPYLIQMALLREPWNEREKEAGSILNIDPECYEPVTKTQRGPTFSWIEHRRNFTTNPCLYSTLLCEYGWPDCSESEGVFGGELFASDPTLKAAYWGAGEPWCRHIGDARVGVGY